MIRSLRRHLLLWILSALSIGGFILLTVSYFVALDELGEVFDDNLRQVALAAAKHHNFEAPQGPIALPSSKNFYDQEGEFDFVTMVWRPDGHLQYASEAGVRLPFTRRTGMTRMMQGEEQWHIYSLALDKGTVQAAQRAASREILAAEVASKSIVPTLLLVLLIGALLVMALRRALGPLDRAAQDVAKRSESSLDPISDQNLPLELRPLIRSLNALLSRLGDAFTAQRKFVADAAHGLRTPITALRLQLQLIEHADDPDTRAQAIADLRSGIERAQHLIEQLLQLSRLEPEAGLQQQPTSLGELVRSAVALLSLKADKKGIDLGAEVTSDATVLADQHQLMVLLENLIDNAIRYAPPGSTIDVRATSHAGRPAIIVQDNGPGIAQAERERVFDRFYRGESAHADSDDSTGSGLGLSIVTTIADRHHADVHLEDGPSGVGLTVIVVFREQ